MHGGCETNQLLTDTLYTVYAIILGNDDKISCSDTRPFLQRINIKVSASISYQPWTATGWLIGSGTHKPSYISWLHVHVSLANEEYYNSQNQLSRAANFIFGKKDDQLVSLPFTPLYTFSCGCS